VQPVVTTFGKWALRMGVAAALLAGASILPANHAAAAFAYSVRTHQNLVYGQSAHGSALTANVESPVGDAKQAPVVIVVHGGGWNSGDKKDEVPYAEAMTSEGFVTVNVNYTLSSAEAPGYPDQIQEIQQAITWTIAHARQYGGDPNQIVLVGFSAGAYLSAMAALRDSNLPGHPIKAVVTLSAPFDFPVVQAMLRQRVAMCGYSPSCPQDKQDPPQDTLAAFATMYDFLGCPTGNCSSQLLRAASPVTHVTTSAPPFLIFNSSDELIPSSQATDMADALKAAGVPEQVVIVPGSQHGEAYLPEVDGTILNYLDQRVGLPPSSLPASGTQPGSSGAMTALIICCAVLIAASLSVVLLAVRRRTARHSNGDTAPMAGR